LGVEVASAVEQQSHEVLEVALDVPAPVAARQALQVADRRGTSRRSSRGGRVRAWWGRAWTELRDPGPILRADRAWWAAAASRADFAELTAAWLRGDLASQPGYYGPVDVDEHLAPGMTDALVALCRAGAVTTGSQAGLVAGDVVQLAWVDAHVPGELLAQLRTAAVGTRYRVIKHTPASGELPVTWVRGTARTSSGWVAPGHWAWLYRGVGAMAVAKLLATTHQVSVIDPEPGRNTLWAWLQDIQDITEPLQEDDDVSCPDCGGSSRLVDCLTCWGRAADLESGDLAEPDNLVASPAGSEVEGAACGGCGHPRGHHSARGCTTDWIWVQGVQIVRGCSCPRTGPCTADAGCQR
jgi:hypothetical protein